MTVLRRFIPAKFRPLTLPDDNPSRGWYQVFRFDITEPFDEAIAGSSLCGSDRLALALIDIGGYKKVPLDDKALGNIADILEFFGKHRTEVIARPVYDTRGRGMESEPLSFPLVKEHIAQVGGVLAGHSRYIHAVQGVFVGNWGEMHGSKFLSDDSLTELAETLMAALGGSCFMNVRTPAQQRLLSERLPGSVKIGLFNDGLFGSETHLGTFADNDGQDRAAQGCRGVPNGGEAVFGGNFTPARTVDTLRTLRATYLNRVYDGRLLDEWKKTPFNGSGSLYDHIGARLGYRFEITAVRAKLSGQSAAVSLTLANSGFGCLTKKAKLRFYAEEEGATPVTAEICDPLPEGGGTKSFECAFTGQFKKAEFFVEIVHENGECIRPVNCPAGKIFIGKIV